MRPRPAARCPAGPRPHAGTVQLSSPAFTVGEASGTPLVLVTRTGGSRGATSVIVNTSGGSARSGVDFKPHADAGAVRERRHLAAAGGDPDPRGPDAPSRRRASRSRSRTCGAAKLGKQRSASVTILDDDQPPPPPPPAFTIGGTVDGLQGSGLVLSNLGAAVPVSANGSFTFPGTAFDRPALRGQRQRPSRPTPIRSARSSTAAGR